MKNFLIVSLLGLALCFKPALLHSQATYEVGYNFAFEYAVDHCLDAAESHPEWNYLIVPKDYYLLGSILNSYTIVDGSGQAAMLAANYVRASYLDGFLAQKDIDDFHRGLYDGFLSGCGAFAMGDF